MEILRIKPLYIPEDQTEGLLKEIYYPIWIYVFQYHVRRMIFGIYIDTSKAVEIAAYVRKVLEVGTLRSGLYDYIAFAGGIKCEKLLGAT